VSENCLYMYVKAILAPTLAGLNLSQIQHRGKHRKRAQMAQNKVSVVWGLATL